MADPDPVSSAPLEQAPGEPAAGPVWGPWATTAFGAVVGAVFVAVQVGLGIVLVLVMTARRPDAEIGALADEIARSGLVLAVSTWLTAFVCCTLLVLLVRLKPGATVRAYLALRPLPRRSLLYALLLVSAFAALYDGTSLLLHRPVVPPFVLDAYRTAGWLPLLWSALVLAAPAFEEALFRGFLLEGWRRSRLGPGGAVVLTSLLWASIHLQYGPYEIAAIFLLGTLLGLVRLRTGSLWGCLAGHALVNLLATLEAALQAHAGG